MSNITVGLVSYLIAIICCLCSRTIFAIPRVGNVVYPIDAGTYDFNFVYNFTKYLHNVYRYNSFVIFSHPSSRFRPSYIVVRDFEQALVEDFNVPIIVWGRTRHAKLRNNIGLNNLVFVQFKGISDPILNTVDYTLEGLHYISILFYFRNKEKEKPTTDEINEFFDWCWQRNMVNVALTFQVYNITIFKNQSALVEIKNQVYKYSPFPNITIHDLTAQIEKGGGDFKIDHIENAHGYEFRTPMATSFPYVFLLKTPPNCNEELPNCKISLSGTTGRLYTEYMKQIGGKIKIENYNNLTYSQYNSKLILAASKKEAHIGVHPFSRLSMSLDSTEGSYPIGQTNVCIIVPLITEHNKSRYFQSPFQTSIWVLITLTFLILMLLQLYLQYDHTEQLYGHYWLTLFGQALITTASILLYQAYDIGSLYKRIFNYKFLYIFMLFMTFLLSSMYTASLTSFLSSVQLGEQINTLEQFMTSGLKILLSQSEKQVYFENAHLPIELSKRFQMVDRATVKQHKDNLNSAYAYIVTSDQWQMFNYKQKHLAKPLFRMPSAELCSATYYIMLPLQWNSPFDLSLALFFMATQESGLAQKWQDMSIAEAKKLKLIEVIKSNEQQWRPLKFQDFVIVFPIIGFLWLIAIFALLGEVWWSKKKQRQSKILADFRKIPMRTQYNKYQQN